MTRPSSRWLIPLAVLPVLVLLAYGFRTNPREMPSPLIGKPAAPFRAHGPSTAQSLALETLRGKVVVVNFWASWCYPELLRGGARRSSAAGEQYKDRGMVLIGVNIQDKEEPARKFLAPVRPHLPERARPGGPRVRGLRRLRRARDVLHRPRRAHPLQARGRDHRRGLPPRGGARCSRSRRDGRGAAPPSPRRGLLALLVCPAGPPRPRPSTRTRCTPSRRSSAASSARACPSPTRRRRPRTRCAAIIRERLAAGDTPEQVVAYFVDKYGLWILLAPPRAGLQPAGLGRAPFAGLAAGLVVLAIRLRRWTGAAPRGVAAPARRPVRRGDARAASPARWARWTGDPRRSSPSGRGAPALAFVLWPLVRRGAGHRRPRRGTAPAGRRRLELDRGEGVRLSRAARAGLRPRGRASLRRGLRERSPRYEGRAAGGAAARSTRWARRPCRKRRPRADARAGARPGPREAGRARRRRPGHRRLRRGARPERRALHRAGSRRVHPRRQRASHGATAPCPGRRQRGVTGSAAGAASRARRSRPRCSRACSARRRQSLRRGALQEAIAAYQAVLKREPRNVDAMTHLGLIVAIGGHADTALETWDKALAHRPGVRARLPLPRRGALRGQARLPGRDPGLEALLALVPEGKDTERVQGLS